MGTAPRRRDPEARRRAIVIAAAELITEVGVDAMTHRMVAARAAVPLGATTQYFATLDDLRAEGLHHLAAEIDARIDGVRIALEADGATAAVLARLIVDGLADARTLQADRAVVTAAVHDPTLRALSRRWWSRVAGFLAPTYDNDRAETAAIFIDGVLWHSLISDTPLDPQLIENGLTAILGAPAVPTGSSADAAPALPALRESVVPARAS